LPAFGSVFPADNHLIQRPVRST